MSDERGWKLEWEMVKQVELYKYYNADPTFYKNVTVTTSTDDVDEEDWHIISKEGTEANLRNQYKGLKRLIEEGELIRNVKLFKAVEKTITRWQEVPG